MGRNQDLVIGLDLGTTNCKAIALTVAGKVIASASSSHTLDTPHPGWAQQDADNIWQGAVNCLSSVAEQISKDRVVAISLSGAMHSLLPVDTQGKPLAPAMTWADQRAAGLVKDLRSRTDMHALYERTGCPLEALYYPAKLRWWVDQAIEITRKAALFVALKDVILFRLTGEWATDLSLASATGLMDTRKLKWDEQALSLGGIPVGKLPILVSPKAFAGKVTDEAARFTGLLPGTPVIAGASDGALANLGAGAVSPGETVITVGTSGAIRHMVDQPKLDPHERTWCYLFLEGRWFAGGAINNGGLAIQWVRDHFYTDMEGEAGFQQLIRDAAEVPAGSGGIVLLPYFTGERNPYWNPSARALISGISLDHKRGHIARAAMEGVGFCLADIWNALGVSNHTGKPARLTGGINQAPVWAQIVSDILDLPLLPIEAGDASVTGAALLGWEALGVQVEGETASGSQSHPAYLPDKNRNLYYQNCHREFQDLYKKVYFSG